MIPVDLKNVYRQGRLIPFIGAGVSMGVTWSENGETKRGPSWRELVDMAITQLGFTDSRLLRARGDDLQILEYFKLKNHGVQRLNNWLHASMRPPDDALKQSPIHTELANLDRCDTYYTTNYDNFLERGMKLNGRECQVVAIEAHMGETRKGTSIVKFHGDFDFPDEMVVTESDYQSRLKLCSPMDYRLRADLLGRTVLFLGYSFRDPNVSYIFSLINEQFKALPDTATGRRAYIVVPDPSDFEVRLFRARNIEIIPIRSLTIGDDYVSLLRELRGDN